MKLRIAFYTVCLFSGMAMAQSASNYKIKCDALYINDPVLKFTSDLSKKDLDIPEAVSGGTSAVVVAESAAHKFFMSRYKDTVSFSLNKVIDSKTTQLISSAGHVLVDGLKVPSLYFTTESGATVMATRCVVRELKP